MNENEPIDTTQFYRPLNRRRLKVEVEARYAEIKKIEDTYATGSVIYHVPRHPLPIVDFYVNQKIMYAFDCYVLNRFAACIIFLGAAVEEEFFRLYDNAPIQEHKNISRKRSKILEWAKTNVTCLTEQDKKTIYAITYARDFLAHSYRNLTSNTQTRLNSGELTAVLPETIEAEPENNMMRQATIRELRRLEPSESIQNSIAELESEGNHPSLDWVNSKECALESLNVVTNLICKTSKAYLSKKIQDEIKNLQSQN